MRSFRIGLSGKNSRMPYEHFVHVFEEGRAEAYSPKPQDAPHPTVVSVEKLSKLSPEKAELKVRAMIEPQIEVLQSVSCKRAELKASKLTKICLSLASF